MSTVPKRTGKEQSLTAPGAAEVGAVAKAALQASSDEEIAAFVEHARMRSETLSQQPLLTLVPQSSSVAAHQLQKRIRRQFDWLERELPPRLAELRTVPPSSVLVDRLEERRITLLDGLRYIDSEVRRLATARIQSRLCIPEGNYDVAIALNNAFACAIADCGRYCDRLVRDIQQLVLDAFRTRQGDEPAAPTGSAGGPGAMFLPRHDVRRLTAVRLIAISKELESIAAARPEGHEGREAELNTEATRLIDFLDTIACALPEEEVREALHEGREILVPNPFYHLEPEPGLSPEAPAADTPVTHSGSTPDAREWVAFSEEALRAIRTACGVPLTRQVTPRASSPHATSQSAVGKPFEGSAQGAADALDASPALKIVVGEAGTASGRPDAVSTAPPQPPGEPRGAVDDKSLDDFELPLPEKLQRLVDGAPSSRAALDDYFNDAVKTIWTEPAAQARAVAIYLDQDAVISSRGLPDEVFRDVGFFAAEMRVRRERCLA